MFTRTGAAAVIALLGIAAVLRPAQAAGTITSFTKTSAGNITFAVPDINPPALAGSQTYGFTLQVQTSFLAGSVMLNAPTIVGTAGNVIPASAFSASCTQTSDPGAIFTSLGVVRLAASAVSCGQISRNSSNTIKFDVTLYLDKMASSAGAFTADTYANGSFGVTANAP